MKDDESEYLSDIIFQRSLKQKLQFEGALAPLLATVVGLTTPRGIQGVAIIIAVVSLVVIALLRWLTFTGRFANEELFIEKTVRPVELFTIIGGVQLFRYGAEQLTPFIRLNPFELTAGLAVLGTVVFIVFVELVFRTYQLGWGTLYYIRYRNVVEKTGELDSAEQAIEAVGSVGELVRLLALVILGRIWLEVAYYVLRDAIPDKGRDKYIEELAEFVENARKLKAGGRNLGIISSFVVAAIIVLPVFVGVAWGLSLVVGTFGGLVLALVVMRLTKHIVGFIYIAFGTLRFDQFITTNKRSIGLLAGYTTVVYLIFFYPL